MGIAVENSLLEDLKTSSDFDTSWQPKPPKPSGKDLDHK